jgi:signal peptidase II
MPSQPVKSRSLLMIWLGLAILVLVADQLTKLWITAQYSYGVSQAVTGFFNLVHVHNYGAAFSFLNNEGGWQRWGFSVFATVVSLVIILWLGRLTPEQKLEGYGLALILGGALGNLYDRLTLGYVVDFLDFHWSGWHFPAFNLADSAITLGAILIILDGILRYQHDRLNKEK